ncbi:DUF305 domain-containing protein [Nocardioides aurantiacus]|uniref:Uncharacterized protein (DUF305 family) n=1 Tax=Nocardioides aurantiacus TaxID=86796 RepID=A0A3N2CYT8_9ACTN|nr:DUF305 domain-containing protein [Nocardioides aurantiacus]ROR92623.1 uncharacterized protein (DUF305 family) [Nocardioides aurantiacus]
MSVSGCTPARRTPRLAALALLGTLTLSACGGTDADPAAEASPSAGPTASDGPRVVQGGEPGEDAREVSGDDAVAQDEWSHDDVMFMQMMVPHHAQALRMSELAPERAQDPRVLRLAERIEAAQGPEITMMAAWLDERALEVPSAKDPMALDHGEHGHASMEGMLTDAQMEALARTRGAAFDELYVRSMIRHHEGAVAMADETAGEGIDARVGELRDDVTASQSAEIARMQDLLDGR